MFRLGAPSVRSGWEQGVRSRSSRAARRWKPSGCSSPTGRTPNTDPLGLEQLGVEVSDHGIVVDERLNAAENVWAIGDCTGVALFTHVGKYQARVAAANVAGRRRPPPTTARSPAVAFTDPQIASVGDDRQATGSSPPAGS